MDNNVFYKYVPNVYLAKCTQQHQRGDVIEVATKYGKAVSCIVFNLIMERDGFYFYSIVREDGYNCQERARRRAERWNAAADNSEKKSAEYFKKSQRHSEFLSLGEPIKVGHHSERGHRKMIEDAWNNTGKMVEMYDKSKEQRGKAEFWEKKMTQVNLPMPESVEYFAQVLEEARKTHEGLKNGTIPRTHSMALAYAKNAVNDAERKLELARKLWC